MGNHSAQESKMLQKDVGELDEYDVEILGPISPG